jgi:hypothetical protein
MASSVPDNVERVAADTYLFRHAGHRSLFVVTDEGVVVTDPLSAGAAREYRAAVAQVTRAPVRWVVYSHYHWDRASGAGLFKEQGAQIIAQERCAERFRDNPNPAVVMPDVTFAERHHVGPPGQGLDLHYFGPSHGDCLTVFVAQPAKLMQVVELVNPPRAAFPATPEVPNIRPHNLRQFFDAVEKLAQDEGITQVLASSVVLTHDGEGGELLSPATAPVSIVAEQAAFWDLVYATVEYARSIEAVGIDSFVRLNRVDLTPFRRFDGYDEKALNVTMRRFVGYEDMGR